jgi:hypothetical protein
MKLIEEWRKAYKYMTVQLATVLVLVSTAYDYLPAVQTYLPEGWVKWVAIAIIIARIVKQKDVATNATTSQAE